MSEEFYKEKTWELMSKRFDSIDAKLDEHEKKIDEIGKSVSRILGWASGAGAVAGIIVAFIKDKIFKL